MKKVLLFTLLFSGVIASCKNEYKGDSESKETYPIDSSSFTTIEWENAQQNFGKINEGQVVEIIFNFKNTGEKPLVFSAVTPGCGCTVAEKPEKPIAPGGEGFIKAEFNSEGRPGSTHKQIEVFTNTAEGRYSLSFEGEVIPKKK